ncbi:TPA: prepilin-type N-terminal cleavage/methylation domain-containing protein [Klebsiella aerogenes]|nr:prepilin-type N-terminal cleavage/methylation domain-containing protein [Klebsiella aerogenes]
MDKQRGFTLIELMVMIVS